MYNVCAKSCYEFQCLFVIQLEIPPERMKNTRVRFSFYHKSTIICECLSVTDIVLCLLHPPPLSLSLAITASKLGKSEPFAMSHLRLMKADDTTITDGEHELYVYNVSILCMHRTCSRSTCKCDRMISLGNLVQGPAEEPWETSLSC